MHQIDWIAKSEKNTKQQLKHCISSSYLIKYDAFQNISEVAGDILVPYTDLKWVIFPEISLRDWWLVWHVREVTFI